MHALRVGMIKGDLVISTGFGFVVAFVWTCLVVTGLSLFDD